MIQINKNALLALLLAVPVLRSHADITTTSPAAAPAGDAASDAYRVSIQQESIRGETDKVKKNLQDIVTQLRLNGLSNAQIMEVLKASDKLSEFSQQDMQQVLNYLQTASNSADGKDQQTAILNAFKSQQDLTVKMENLANHVSFQQTQDGITTRLQQLILRQSENVRRTQTLSASSDSPAQIDPSLKNYYQLAVVEQNTMSKGIDLLAADLQNATGDKNGSPGDLTRAKNALDQLHSADLVGLPDLSSQAAQATQQGPLKDALKWQSSLKAELLKLMTTWYGKEETGARLARAREELDKISQEQKALADATKNGTMDAQTLAEKQNKLTDRAAMAEQLLKAINPDSAQALDKAQGAMEKSSTALDANKASDAAAQQDDALKDLASAMDAVKSQEKDLADKQKESASDMMKDLQALKDKVDKAQQAAQNNTDPNLQKDVADLQKSAADLNPQVADDLDKATSALKQDDKDTAAATPPLADASQALQQQMDSLSQAAQQDAALAQADSDLAKAQQAAADAAAAMQSGDQSGDQKAQEARDLAAAQQAADQAAQSGALSDQQKGDAQSASDAFKNGENQTVQGDGPGAQAQTGKGQQALQSARQSLAQAREAARQQGQMAMSQAGQGQGQGQSQTPSDSDNMSPGSLMAKQATSKHIIKAGNGAHSNGALVIGTLSVKDRAAISQTEGQKVAPEYSAMVRQYRENLSESAPTP